MNELRILFAEALIKGLERNEKFGEFLNTLLTEHPVVTEIDEEYTWVILGYE